MSRLGYGVCLSIWKKELERYRLEAMLERGIQIVILARTLEERNPNKILCLFLSRN